MIGRTSCRCLLYGLVGAAALFGSLASVQAQAKKKAAPPPPPDFQPIATKWEAALGRAVSAAQFHEVAEEALLRVEPATAVDQFAAAERLVHTALTAANKAKHPRLQDEAHMRQKDVAAERMAFDAAQEALATLRRTPNDASANLVLGKYLCFTKKDWTTGFAKLALGDDDKLKALAEQSTAALTDAARRAAVGDAWWNEALLHDDGPTRLEYRLAAAYFYAQALPTANKLLDENIKRRLAETSRTVEQDRVLPGLIEVPLNADVALRMRLIPAGTMVIGSPPTEFGRRRTEAQQRVAVPRPFYLGVTEVTREQWSSLVRGGSKSRSLGDEKLPAETVSWNDCQLFFDRLNGLPAGGRYRFRLPTSGEWEYACRAGSPRAYFFGDDPTQLGPFAWYVANSGAKTRPVGQTQPNAWGLYDMLGNVREWTADLGTTVGGQALDENGARAEELRIVRGGDYTSEARNCRAARLFLHDAAGLLETVGLRAACDVLPRNFAEHAPTPPIKKKKPKLAAGLK